MPSQVRIIVGSHTDFSFFLKNLTLTRVLSTNFDVVSDFENPNLIPKPSSKKKTGYIYSMQTSLFY